MDHMKVSLLIFFSWLACGEGGVEDQSFYVSPTGLAPKLETVYTLMKDKMTWNQATEACRKTFGQFGGMLVKFSDPSFSEKIFEALTNSMDSFWTGLYCTESSCDRRLWSDCSMYEGSGDQLNENEDGRCYYASRKDSASLIKGQCSEKRNYVCQYVNPNVTRCNNSCDRTSGINSMCHQVALAVTTSSANDSKCYSQCTRTQGCWLFWDANKDTCVIAVDTCYNINSSKTSVSVSKNNEEVPVTCTSATVTPGSASCPSSTAETTSAVSAGQSCSDTTVTSTVTTTTLQMTTLSLVVTQPAATVTLQPTLAAGETVTVYGGATCLPVVPPSPSSCLDSVTVTLQPSELMTSFPVSKMALTESALSPGNYDQTTLLRTETVQHELLSSTSREVKDRTEIPDFDAILESMTSSIVQELRVTRESLSRIKRLKVSVYDGRTSSTVSGVAACVFLGLAAACVVAIDVTKFYGPLLRTFHSCKS